MKQLDTLRTKRSEQINLTTRTYQPHTISKESPIKKITENSDVVIDQPKNYDTENNVDFDIAAKQCEVFLDNIRQLYDSRYNFLKDYLDNTIKHIKQDHVLLAMKDDPTLNEFLNQRIKEIINDSTAAEREIEIHNLMQELAINKAEKFAQESEVKKLSSRVQELERQENEVAEKWADEQEIYRRKQQEAEELRKELTSMGELSKSIEQSVSQKEKDYSSKIQSYEEKIIEMKSETEELRKQLENTYAELQSSKLDKNQVDIQLSQISQSIKEYEQENSILKSKIRELEQLVFVKENEIKELKAQKRDLSENLRSYEDELKSFKKKLDDLYQAKQIEEEKYKDHTEKYKELLAAEKEHYLSIISGLKEKKQKYKKDLLNLKTMNDDNCLTIKKLEEAQKMKDIEINSLTRLSSEKDQEKLRKLEEQKRKFEREIQEIQENSRRSEEELDNQYKQKMTEIENLYKEVLDKKCKELERDFQEEMRKHKKLETDNLKSFQEKIEQFEKEWIPITKHEHLVNAELEKLESEYQEQISTVHQSAVKQVESRMKDELENAQRQKHKVEMYVKELEALNEQLRSQLSKKPRNLMNSARFSPGSFLS